MVALRIAVESSQIVTKEAYRTTVVMAYHITIVRAFRWVNSLHIEDIIPGKSSMAVDIQIELVKFVVSKLVIPFLQELNQHLLEQHRNYVEKLSVCRFEEQLVVHSQVRVISTEVRTTITKLIVVQIVVDFKINLVAGMVFVRTTMHFRELLVS